MIIALTTRGHSDTLLSLSDGTFGFPVPKFALETYDRILCARRVPKATYIFTDLERLAPWELRGAGELYQALTEQGLRCLNNPARAKSRVELLRALHAANINPFTVYRAEEEARPSKFPVLVRNEDDHWRPLPNLIDSQSELEASLEGLRKKGVPLRGVLIVEFCGEPYSDTLWNKWGTFRIGDELSVDHIAVDDNWLVKRGVYKLLTDSAVADEHEAVKSNRYAQSLRAVFDIAGIEFGRADHATVSGRTVVYEINSNPYIHHYVPDPKLLRRETFAIARQRFAGALAKIDTPGNGTVTLKRTKFEMRQRRSWLLGRVPWRFGHVPLKRP